MSATCPYCQSPIEPETEPRKCPGCSGEYHPECWDENGGCGVYGCSEAPTVEPRKPVEIPVSFWGQERKPCPSCGRNIQAAALRCRHCGALFASTQPEDSERFRRRAVLEHGAMSLQRWVVGLFILCLVPITSPLGGVFGAIHYVSRRGEIRAMPPVYGVLARIGLGVAVLQTVVFATIILAFYVLNPDF